jgi:phospholipase/carboxylesterase
MMQPDPQLVATGEAVTRTGLVHRVLRPDGTPPYPTVVMLHGRAGNEDVMWIFAQALPAEWLVLAPRALAEDPLGGYSWRIREREAWPTLAQFDVPVGAVVDFVEALPDLYGADLDHLYLMGFSQGAATAFAVAMRHPALVRGIAGLVGFLPMECDDVDLATALKGKPVFIAVGKEDERIPYERSLECARTLHLAGANLDYHEYDVGHRLNAQAMRDLQSWWQEQAQTVAVD